MDFSIDEFDSNANHKALIPTKAWIAYTHQHSHNSQPYLAEHDFEKINGEFVLGAAQLMTKTAQAHLGNALLEKATQASFIPSNVVATYSDGLAWFVPAKVWSMSTTVKSKIKRIKIPMPPHVIMCRGTTVSAFALKKNVRPDRDTKFYICPVPNFSLKGNLCKGSVKFPPNPKVDDISEIEQGIFHTLGSSPHCQSIKGVPQAEHMKFIYSLENKKHFSVAKLIETGKTLAETLGV